jgi:hypothetical protein
VACLYSAQSLSFDRRAAPVDFCAILHARGIEMPKSPKDLSDLIRELARQEAESLGKSLSGDAEDRIATVPPPYNTQSQIPVDVQRLQLMIHDIISIAADENKKEIALDDIESALARVKCHYLWFC